MNDSKIRSKIYRYPLALIISGEYNINIRYDIVKMENSIEGILEYKGTDEICNIGFTLEEDDSCTCNSVYRKVRGEDKFVFLMSRESVGVKSAIEKIYADVFGKVPKEVRIPPEFCLQTRMKKREEDISKEIILEFKNLGTWEEDNLDSL